VKVAIAIRSAPGRGEEGVSEVKGSERAATLISMSGTGSSGSGGSSLRPLAATLIAGALWDFAFALGLVLAPGWLHATLSLPLPGEPFYLRVIAALLVIAGGFYWITARDPRSRRPYVAMAIAGRVGGFVALGASAIGRPELAGLWIAAGGDLLFAVAHAATGRSLLR
jgi:hypothetical protein